MGLEGEGGRREGRRQAPARCAFRPSAPWPGTRPRPSTTAPAPSAPPAAATLRPAAAWPCLPLEEKETSTAKDAPAIKPLTTRRGGRGESITPLSVEGGSGPGSKSETRRPSIDAPGQGGSQGGGGGYMGETTASRHRLLGKLNVDLTS